MFRKNRKYTIAITANTSWYLYNFRRNTINSLLDMGYNVVAIAPRDNYSKQLSSLGCRYIPIDIDQGGMNPIKDFITILKMAMVLYRNQFNIILNFTPKNNIYFSILAKTFNIGVINNIAGLGIIFVKKGFISRLCTLLYKFSQRDVDKIFFQNEDDRTLFLKEIIPDAEKTDRVPGSGVDLTRFSVKEAPDDGVVRFILVARMLYHKGIEQYVEAARQLKTKYGDRCEFRLLGFVDINNPAAVAKEKIETWVNDGIINYLGVSDNVEQELSIADCVVLPSFYREGVPKSLLEAGAMGKPIITTRNVGCQETVDDDYNGFLCEPQSTESLIDALERMISLSHKERLAMGLNSRKKIVREFDENIVIEKYIESIGILLKRELYQ
ncbi:glycosyltransferase family 4 protein [Pragia fontium]|uniref:Glycosyltransferase involved in cell wall bisynthesis n=1 Tax=Pragia fontium DSM 5563 = ATCC 49100 TaxID=1122977 RepID=A0AAJ4WCY8_9GAMM|nr:glycosyltransferase family 4 protein [Pragia fontium]AKJ43445.1 glycosyl transferase family 1 [Pragia fontium]SFD28861.1 Glycosyltransferase involved in cell wall bisynthesis [Pragia fontium DSM 5563 = ATCC 49100]SUB83914.1 colanic acid biosynthesis glycosyltransferase WcaL [Pragia fontium]VEJ56817.1 colanic acid biosynthesis glycosyltransferase WcaL [Pragia fontium]